MARFWRDFVPIPARESSPFLVSEKPARREIFFDPPETVSECGIRDLSAPRNSLSPRIRQSALLESFKSFPNEREGHLSRLL